MAAIYENTGIVVNVSNPVVQDGSFVTSLKEPVTSYTHEISSENGFDRADITFAVNRKDLSGWLNRGLGMDVDVRAPSGVQIWNGFVDSVDVNDGARKVSIGRMSDIANCVAVAYGIIIEGADEPLVGDQTATDYANDTDSQNRYGVWEKVVNAGSRTESEANQIRDTILAKYAYPNLSYNVTMGGEGASVSLKCFGYHRFLEAFTYNSSDNDEVLTSTKVQYLLAAEGLVNGVLNSDTSRIESGSVYVGTFEDQDRTALVIAQECAAFGDAQNNTWTFGIYEDRQIVFKVIPGTIAYRHRRGVGPTVERMGGGTIDPWLVRPANWLFMPDMILGGAELPIPDTRAQMYADRRMAFVERVTYTAPQGLAIYGSRVNRPAQQLARWGLGNL